MVVGNDVMNLFKIPFGYSKLFAKRDPEIALRAAIAYFGLSPFPATCKTRLPIVFFGYIASKVTQASGNLIGLGAAMALTG